jgi:shikimate 5-dehydrogenase
LNRTVNKAEFLAKSVIHHFNKKGLVKFGGEEDVFSAVKGADLIVNVSTKGGGELEDYCALAPADLPATAKNIKKNLKLSEKVFKVISLTTVISDIVLSKKSTPLLRMAQERGFTTLDGKPMVINQGVEAFWILHGKELENRQITKEELVQVMSKAAYS